MISWDKLQKKLQKAPKCLCEALEKLVKAAREEDIYDKAQPTAERVKAIVQMMIGVSSAIILLVQFGTHFGEGMGQAADRALLGIGVALSFSAVVELAYTFFTDGPDEALDPLILGVSAFALIIISQYKWTDEPGSADAAKNLAKTPDLNAISIPVLLLALSIFILFVTRRFLLQVRKRDANKEKDADKEKKNQPPVT